MCFPYSRREWNAVRAEWKALSAQVVRDRVRGPDEMAGLISKDVRSRYLGRSFEILAEHKNERTGVSEGFTHELSQGLF